MNRTPVEHARLVRGGTAFYPPNADDFSPDSWAQILDAAKDLAAFVVRVVVLLCVVFTIAFLAGRYFS